MRVTLLALAALALSSAACSSLPAATSSVIGCFEDEIEIHNAANGPSGDTWTATCHGHTFDCAREEKHVESSGWVLAAPLIPYSSPRVEHQNFYGSMTGDTYCIQR